MSQLPTCTSGADLARLDGQRVVLVGTYRKRIVSKKMGQPATQFYGHAQIELTGKATDYDPSAWDGALAIVRIGTDKRPDDEIAKLADQPVTVEGRLVLLLYGLQIIAGLGQLSFQLFAVARVIRFDGRLFRGPVRHFLLSRNFPFKPRFFRLLEQDQKTALAQIL